MLDEPESAIIDLGGRADETKRMVNLCSHLGGTLELEILIRGSQRGMAIHYWAAMPGKVVVDSRMTAAV